MMDGYCWEEEGQFLIHGLRAKPLMGGYIGEEEDPDGFFDAREEISSVSDCSSDCSEGCSSSSGLLYSLQHDAWTRNPDSVANRRQRFMKSMNLSLDMDLITREDSGIVSFDEIQLAVDRITEDSEAVLRCLDLEEEFSTNQSYMLTSTNYAPESIENGAVKDNEDKTKNLDDQIGFIEDESGVVDELGQGGMLNRLSEAGLSQSVSSEEFQRSPVWSPLVRQHLCREDDEARDFVDAKGEVKKRWLRKLGALACIAYRHEETALEPHDQMPTSGARMRSVRVESCGKRSKELSSLYIGQEFRAHEGSILTMKFSLDGRYLASAGEDCVVRVWKIIEDDRVDNFDILKTDPSYLCFTMNHLSRLAPLKMDNEKVDKMRSLRRSSDSTCVILPPKVFRLSEKPLHEFQGHVGEILNLSWSKQGFLLSSSVDNTVRLWQVGCDRCLRVFSHNNYVTCVDFNPMDGNYFISGSIDGKVRIWEVISCRVVDYIDIKEIVTAVCYRPDGKGGIVGSMTGNCRFYNLIDNRLQLDTQICLQGKKKLPGKRITGFQFSPTDPNKVMVTSADSHVRILHRADVICKLRASGLRITRSPIVATFTSDGKHIVSASEDCNVYIWNDTSPDKPSSQTKNIWSCENFISHNASVAITWGGIETTPGTLPSPMLDGGLENGHRHLNLLGELDQKIPNFSTDFFSLTRGFLLESLTKGSMTWPEESLPDPSPKALSPMMGKSKLKVLKSACQSMLSSPHMWGLVIVTATWDGRIRAYHNYGLPIHI